MVIFPLNTANVISGFINLVRFTFLAQVGCWTPTSPIWARPSHASATALVLLGANQHRKLQDRPYSKGRFSWRIPDKRLALKSSDADLVIERLRGSKTLKIQQGFLENEPFLDEPALDHSDFQLHCSIPDLTPPDVSVRLSIASTRVRLMWIPWAIPRWSCLVPVQVPPKSTKKKTIGSESWSLNHSDTVHLHITWICWMIFIYFYCLSTIVYPPFIHYCLSIICCPLVHPPFNGSRGITTRWLADRRRASRAQKQPPGTRAC